jgi:hypothetical protein
LQSYGGVGSQTGGMHHGHGGKSPEEDIDTEKFFASSQKRLMITIPVHLAYHLYWLHCQSTRIFHKVSDILSLLPSGIDVNPKSVEADELVEHAWKVMEPYYHDSIDKICDAPSSKIKGYRK